MGELKGLPLESEDVALILQIVMRRLEATRTVKKGEPASLNKLARDVFRISRRRNDVLGGDCCPDPEWNMLLDLVVGYTESRPTDVGGLCIASGVPATTALSHLKRMEASGLVYRTTCDKDRRRVWVEPTVHALTATEGLLREVYRAGTS